MQALQSASARTETFLERLGAEEQLLALAVEKANEVYAVLRCGDLKAVNALGIEQEHLASELRTASAARLEATAALVADLNISAEPITLTVLADSLPGPESALVQAARERLRALASELTRIQIRNANLLGHLRSFFRDVFAEVTADDGPLRYGSSGQWLPTTPAPPLLKRGTAS